MIAFKVNTLPIAQPRQRHGIVNGHVRNYLPSDNPVHAFKAAVQLFARQAYNDKPLDVRCLYRSNLCFHDLNR